VRAASLTPFLPETSRIAFSYNDRQKTLPISEEMARYFIKRYHYESGGNSVMLVIEGKNSFDRIYQSMHSTIDSLTEV
jgi:hypothetical protein